MVFPLFLPRAIHEGWRLCPHFMEKTSRLPRSKALSDAKILDQMLFRAVIMVSQQKYSGQRKKMKMGSSQDSIASLPGSSWRQSNQDSISHHPAHCGDWYLLLSAAPLWLHFIPPSPRLRQQTWAYPCTIEEYRLSKCLITDREFPEIPVRIFIYLAASFNWMFVSCCSWVAQDYQLLLTTWKAQNFQITPDPNGKNMFVLISWAMLLLHLVWFSLLTQKYYKLWTQKAQQDLTGLLSENWGKQQSKANQAYSCMWWGTIYYSWKINRFISG